MSEQMMEQAMEDCLFCSIAAGEIPADVVLDEPDIVAFRDIAPQAPLHVLVIPRRHHRDMAAVVRDDADLGGRMLAAAAALAEEFGGDYRLVANTGPGAGQSVWHAHVHVLAGRPMGWPPG
jgi:histidine triad (HIT) family protein